MIHFQEYRSVKTIGLPDPLKNFRLVDFSDNPIPVYGPLELMMLNGKVVMLFLDGEDTSKETVLKFRRVDINDKTRFERISTITNLVFFTDIKKAETFMDTCDYIFDLDLVCLNTDRNTCDRIFPNEAAVILS